MLHKEHVILLISIFLLFFVKRSNAQNPSYFTIGERELSNVEIYSVLETNSGELYVGTNNGVFYYTQGGFVAMSSLEEQNGTSFFGLVETKEGKIFCNNLSGQVFEVKENKLSLYYTLPFDKVYGTPSLELDNEERLILSADGVFDISDPNEIKSLSNNRAMGMKKLIDGRVVIRNKFGYLSVLKKGKVTPFLLNHNNLAIDFGTIFLHENKLLGNYRKKGIRDIKTFKKINGLDSLEFKDRIWQFSKGEIWSLSNSKGVKKINIINDTLQKKNTFFKNTYFSTIFKSTKGTIFLGTFGRGLVVIPNINVLSSQLSNAKSVRSIAVSKGDTVYFADSRRGIVRLNDNKEIKLKTSRKQVNYSKVFYDDRVDFKNSKKIPGLYVGNYQLGKNDGPFGSVKDIYVIDSSAVLIASSVGLSKLGENTVLEGMNWRNRQIWGMYSQYPKINKRAKAVVFDKKNKSLFLATNNILLKINPNNDIQEVKYKEKNINANSLLYFNNSIWIGTDKNGILVYKDGEWIEQINVDQGLLSYRIRQIEVLNNKLFVLGANKLQCITLNTKSIFTFGRKEGVIGYINEFKVSKNKLWLLINNERVVNLALKNIPEKNSKPNFMVDSIVVGGELLSNTDKQFFSYNQNKVEVYTSIKNVTTYFDSSIYYKISSIDENWNVKKANSKKAIVYKTLPPGTYTFSIYAQYGNQKSDVKTYEFAIHPPFWQEWWFYGLVIFLFTGSGYLYYYNKLKDLKQKEKEKQEKQALEAGLLETQLIAIRSQMNPHFIFNALNSIQDLVLREDTDTSYDYIVLFSKLVRSTLNYSNKDFIDLGTEIEFLEVYLKLEKLRFGGEFTYVITSDVKEALETPSLLIQPFVENALLHGLLHKEGKKHVSIHFEFTDELICTIVDNGVGRIEVQKIHKRQGKINDSFALAAIEKRLQIFSKQNHKNVGYTIVDLYKNEKATGTKVVISLPYNIKI